MKSTFILAAVLAAAAGVQADSTISEINPYAYGANTGWVNGRADDANGIPDAWEYKNYGKLNVFSSTGDWDNDSVSDVDEYLADTQPDDIFDQLRISAFAVDGSTNSVTWTARPTRIYTVQQTDTLGTGWTDAVAPFIPATAGDVTESVNTGRFFRVQATLPLNP